MYVNTYLEECRNEEKGSHYVLRAYLYTQNNNFDTLVINDLGFIDNYADELNLLKETLIKADIKEFILTQSSSGLMDVLHALDSVGIVLKGVTTIKHIDTLRVRPKEETIKGLQLVVEG